MSLATQTLCLCLITEILLTEKCMQIWVDPLRVIRAPPSSPPSPIQNLYFLYFLDFSLFVSKSRLPTTTLPPSHASITAQLCELSTDPPPHAKMRDLLPPKPR